MAFIVIMIIIAIAIIALIVRYLYVQAHILSSKEFRKTAEKQTFKMRAKSTEITCDFCGCVINTAKEKRCPNCGAVYGEDKELKERFQVDEKAVEKKADAAAKEAVEKAHSEGLEVLKHIKIAIAALAGVFVLMIIYAAIFYSSPSSSYAGKFRENEKLQDNDYTEYTLISEPNVTIFDKEGVTMRLVSVYADDDNAILTDGMRHYRLGISLVNTRKEPVSLYYKIVGINGRCKSRQLVYIGSHFKAGAKVVEVASFDIQKIKNPDISGTDYQQGKQLDFWNVREYVLFRDGHVCQCCKGKSKDKILNVHHIESRKTGGNAPNNLITLCGTCHTGYHKGTVKLPRTIHRGISFKDATFMGIMRWALYEKIKSMYLNVKLTYGYITKNTRIENGLPKDHYIDARCISGNPNAVSNGEVFHYKKVRCHNRQIHKCKVLKGGIRKHNQATYYVMDYRMYDRVSYQGKPYIIFGRRNSGFFDIRTLDGTKANKGSISYKKLRLIEPQSNYIVEKRTA